MGDPQIEWATYIPGVQRVLHMSVSHFPPPCGVAQRSSYCCDPSPRNTWRTSSIRYVSNTCTAFGVRQSMGACRRWRGLVGVLGRRRMIIRVGMYGVLFWYT